MATQPLDLLSYVNDGSIATPFFEKQTLADQQNDGYWIEAVDINGNGKLDLVTSGLAVGQVVWYENPTWKKRLIADFPLPVAIDQGDIAGNGRNDLVISHNYGNCMFWCRPEDGKVSWLENPGHYERDDEPWNVHFITDLMAAHRLQVGYFTQKDRLELLGLPVVGCQPYGKGVHEPVAITLLDRPDNVLDAPEWKGRIIDQEHFRVIHGVVRHKFGGYSGKDLDSLLFASEEGINWFYYDTLEAEWKIVPIGEGEPENAGGFRGCGNVAFGKVGDDPYAYIATIDPFHGNIVTVYTHKPGKEMTDHPWKRTVLDVFGEFDPKSQGPGHHVVTGDFDGDGDDEFLVALRGPLPHQGVYYYKAIDVENGLFERWRVSTASAARIAVGDFNGDGRLDFATTGYYTPGYYLCDNSQVNIYYNQFA